MQFGEQMIISKRPGFDEAIIMFSLRAREAGESSWPDCEGRLQHAAGIACLRDGSTGGAASVGGRTLRHVDLFQKT
eukprot:CAMPEP_0206423682 /NCGR_PEP_ID=MMETSP0324_2-20121206/2806_1 /ASSEMBLY_ACC=CAM_ASM_000836 /TAXON_ID=2866 /ORGANISM="Crypthecodinium cohnii, Strain Seligo" /LENGTH=75 /DNA_ID=CAMNT_0053888249 /DNA_START=458 /DNA_END=681 /DNA_ORIENTATION=-